MNLVVEVCCPTCFETFGIVPPAPEELPAELDYDCEICCRPMVISVDAEDDDPEEIWASARSLDE